MVGRSTRSTTKTLPLTAHNVFAIAVFAVVVDLVFMQRYHVDKCTLTCPELANTTYHNIT